MKIGIIGATGHAGSALVQAALRQGHTVVAIVRDAAKAKAEFNDTVTVLEKDAMAITLADLAGLDAVVNAVAPTPAYRHLDIAAHLISVLRDQAKPRIAFILGASSLRQADGTLFLAEVEKLAAGAAWIAGPRQQVHEYHFLQWVDNVDWTAVSPQADFVVGPKTAYRLGQDTVMLAPDGQSKVTTGNLAAALIRELEDPQFIRQRFTVVDA